jgi:hypothetical protein
LSSRGPSAATDSNARAEVLSLFHGPNHRPMPVLCLYCHYHGPDTRRRRPALRFGHDDTLPNHLISEHDLAGAEHDDHAFVFLNACGTATSLSPIAANPMQDVFFRRGCCAYVGSEAWIPARLASRFALAFFHFFGRRRPEDLPWAAGEAFTQARQFLWTRYRNLGGLLYSYVNDYNLFLATDAEIAPLRLPG